MLPWLVGVVVVITIALVGWLIYEHIVAPTKGTVHNKQYNPPYTSIQCTTINKSTSCYPVYHPADYEFDLYDGSNHGWQWVTPAAFDRYNVGDWYPG